MAVGKNKHSASWKPRDAPEEQKHTAQADAQRRVDASVNEASDFKFFFNFAKWGPGELEEDVRSGRWRAFQNIPADLILSQDLTADKGALWRKLRTQF